MKFDENLSSGSRADTRGEADWHGEENWQF